MTYRLANSMRANTPIAAAMIAKITLLLVAENVPPPRNEGST
jgi:hypothetical protein